MLTSWVNFADAVFVQDETFLLRLLSHKYVERIGSGEIQDATPVLIAGDQAETRQVR